MLGESELVVSDCAAHNCMLAACDSHTSVTPVRAVGQHWCSADRPCPPSGGSSYCCKAATRRAHTWNTPRALCSGVGAAVILSRSLPKIGPGAAKPFLEGSALVEQSNCAKLFSVCAEQLAESRHTFELLEHPIPRALARSRPSVERKWINQTETPKCLPGMIVTVGRPETHVSSPSVTTLRKCACTNTK